jgi:hypothetical protein
MKTHVSAHDAPVFLVTPARTGTMVTLIKKTKTA